jgi:hypothetical protein
MGCHHFRLALTLDETIILVDLCRKTIQIVPNLAHFHLSFLKNRLIFVQILKK